MPQPTKEVWRNSHANGVRASDVDKLLNALRALDHIVVEISTRIYKMSRRDRAAMLEQNCRLHETIRERLSQFLY